MIDTYVLTAYAILAVYVLQIAVVSRIYSQGYEEVAAITDPICACLFFLIWIYRTSSFVYGWWDFKHRDVDWEGLSRIEYEGWSDAMKEGSKYIGVADGHFLGTNDK